MDRRNTPLEHRLVLAGIELFGRHGLDGVGTRALAEAAGAQMSAIAYHYGGKDGLYLACARHIATEMDARIGSTLAETASVTGAAEARTAVLMIISRLTTIMMNDDIASMARLVVREQMAPTAAFSVIYDAVIGRLVERLSDLLIQVSNGRLPPEEARLRTMALVGQVLTFRFARATLMAATGWHEAGAAETEQVRAVVTDQARAVLATLSHTDVERTR